MIEEYLKDPIYKRFHAALLFMLKKGGEWHRKQSELGRQAGVAKGHMSDIKNGNRRALYQQRNRIAKACGYDYFGFINLGSKILKKRNLPTGLVFKNETIKEKSPFKNKQLSDEVIKLLVELESIDPFELASIGSIVREKITILKNKNRIDEPVLKPEQVPKKRVG